MPTQQEIQIALAASQAERADQMRMQEQMQIRAEWRAAAAELFVRNVPADQLLGDAPFDRKRMFAIAQNCIAAGHALSMAHGVVFPYQPTSYEEVSGMLENILASLAKKKQADNTSIIQE